MYSKFGDNQIEITTLMRIIILWRKVISTLQDPHRHNPSLTIYIKHRKCFHQQDKCRSMTPKEMDRPSKTFS